MIIFNSLDDIKTIEETGIALGNFDGIHIGHQKLIKRAVDNSRSSGLKSMVLTFTNHPKNLKAKSHYVKNIVTWKEKVEIIEALGVDYLVAIEFNQEILSLSPEDFVQKILLEKLRMKEAHCGFHYHFGYKASGNTQLLIKLGDEYDFGIHILEAVKVDGQLVSSTKIRELISSGQVCECQKYLGRPYTLEGTVVTGNQIGRKIGFPTSNILIDETMVIPPNGVYITNCFSNGVKYNSVTNIGVKPTVGRNKRSIETHLINFSKNIYDEEIKIEFMQKIRDEKKFEDFPQLIQQIQEDVIKAKEYHNLR